MFIAIGLLSTVIMTIALRAVNARRLKYVENPDSYILSKVERSEKGDKAPNFIYTL